MWRGVPVRVARMRRRRREAWVVKRRGGVVVVIVNWGGGVGVRGGGGALWDVQKKLVRLCWDPGGAKTGRER